MCDHPTRYHPNLSLCPIALQWILVITPRCWSHMDNSSRTAKGLCHITRLSLCSRTVVPEFIMIFVHQYPMDGRLVTTPNFSAMCHGLKKLTNDLIGGEVRRAYTLHPKHSGCTHTGRGWWRRRVRSKGTSASCVYLWTHRVRLENLYNYGWRESTRHGWMWRSQENPSLVKRMLGLANLQLFRLTAMVGLVVSRDW